MQYMTWCDIVKFANVHNCLNIFILSNLPQYFVPLCPNDVLQKKPQATLRTPIKSRPARTVMSAKGLQTIPKAQMKPLIKGL